MATAFLMLYPCFSTEHKKRTMKYKGINIFEHESKPSSFRMRKTASKPLFASLKTDPKDKLNFADHLQNVTDHRSNFKLQQCYTGYSTVYTCTHRCLTRVNYHGNLLCYKSTISSTPVVKPNHKEPQHPGAFNLTSLWTKPQYSSKPASPSIERTKCSGPQCALTRLHDNGCILLVFNICSLSLCMYIWLLSLTIHECIAWL